ncbi:hypothetical protein K439DRAFT_1634095 [Ramaria rubella]|nr:hypothetical protein K439DRAFT_1634095 [Ramaria rubella]
MSRQRPQTPTHFPSPTPNNNNDLATTPSAHILSEDLSYHAVAMVNTPIGWRFGIAEKNSFDIKFWAPADETYPGVVEILHRKLATSPNASQSKCAGALEGVESAVVKFFLGL